MEARDGPATFHAIAMDASERQSADRSRRRQFISDEELQDIRAYVRQQRALGSTCLQAAIETALGVTNQSDPLADRREFNPPGAQSTEQTG